MFIFTGKEKFNRMVITHQQEHQHELGSWCLKVGRAGQQSGTRKEVSMATLRTARLDFRCSLGFSEQRLVIEPGKRAAPKAPSH